MEARRNNKYHMSTADGSSSHLNHTESSYSNNVGSASNMIPCFPTSNGTDAHHCDTISNHSSPSQFTKDSPSILIFPKSEPGQLQTIYATALKIKKGIIREIVIKGNAHATVHLRTINHT